MNFTVAENPAAAKAHALAVELRDGRVPDAQIAARAEALLPELVEAANELRRTCSELNPALREWLKHRPEHPMRQFASAPVVLFPGITEDAVIARWREQLRAAASSVGNIIAGVPGIYGEWLYYHDRGDGRDGGHPFYCAEQVRDCFREIIKLAALLRAPRRVVPLKRGPVLCADSFAGPLSGWQNFHGECYADGGRLNVKGMGVSVWREQDFSNACVAFDFSPVHGEGNAYGTLFAFPGSPRAGHDYSISAGAMHLYNHGIDTYHASLCRNTCGHTNLRRAGAGLKMLSTVIPDPCQRFGGTYRVELIKFDETIQVVVDGVLYHSYVDAGCYGTPPARGRFGVRHFAGEGSYHTQYANFSITELA